MLLVPAERVEQQDWVAMVEAAVMRSEALVVLTVGSAARVARVARVAQAEL